MWNLVYVVSFMFSSVLCSNDNSIKFYITLSSSTENEHIDMEFKIVIWEIVKSSLKDTNKICKDIYDHINNTGKLIDIILQCINSSFKDYSSNLQIIEKLHFLTFSRLIYLELGKKDGIYLSEINNLISDLQNKITPVSTDAEKNIECFYFFSKAIKNICKLVGIEEKKLFIKIYQNQENYSKYFYDFKSKKEIMMLKSLVYDRNFCYFEISDVSIEKINQMISKILKEITEDVDNVAFYFDIRLENFFVCFFSTILNDVTRLVKKLLKIPINEVTKVKFYIFQNGLKAIIEKLFETYLQTWNEYIFGNNEQIEEIFNDVFDNITFNFLDYDTKFLFKMLHSFALSKGFKNEDILLLIYQNFISYDHIFKCRLIFYFKKQIALKFKKQTALKFKTVMEKNDDDIDVTKLYNNITNLKHRNDRVMHSITECDDEED